MTEELPEVPEPDWEEPDWAAIADDLRPDPDELMERARAMEEESLRWLAEDAGRMEEESARAFAESARALAELGLDDLDFSPPPVDS